MASFFRLITAVVEVADDATDVTISFDGSLVIASVQSWAVPQAGFTSDGEDDAGAPQVESRPSSHLQAHQIQDSR